MVMEFKAKVEINYGNLTCSKTKNPDSDEYGS